MIYLWLLTTRAIKGCPNLIYLMQTFEQDGSVILASVCTAVQAFGDEK